MNNFTSARITLLLSVVLLVLIAGCQPGGGSSSADPLAMLKETALTVAANEPAPIWQTNLPGEAVDLLTFVDEQRILIGSMEVPEVSKLPSHGPLLLFKADSGTLLWQAERPALPAGSYRLLVDQPVIVLQGQEGDNGQLIAYDPTNGRKLWQKTYSGTARVLPAADGSSLFVASRDKNSGSWQIMHLVARSGKGWQASLSHKDEDPPLLLQDDRRVYCAGSSIEAFDLRKGQRQWRATPAGGDDLVGIQLGAKGLLWSGAERMCLLDPASGKVRWDTKMGQSTASFAMDSSQVYRLQRNAAGRYSVQSYALADGHRGWSKDLTEPPASGLAPADRQLWLSDTQGLYALDTRSGQQLLRATLPPVFAQHGPYEYSQGGQLDILSVEPRQVVLIREGAGVLAVDRGTGRISWEQRLASGSAQYTISAKSTLIQTIPVPRAFAGSAKRIRDLGAKARRTIGTNSSAIPSRRIPDYSSARVYIPSSSTLLQRQIGHTQNMASSTRDMVEAIAEAGRAQTQMGFELGAAIGQTILAIRYAKARISAPTDQEAEASLVAWSEGKMQRYALESQAASGYHVGAYGGRYLLRPFNLGSRADQVDVSGLTLVDLSNGTRSDLRCGLKTFAQLFNGLDMPAFAISPSGRQVVVNGVGLDPARYDVYAHWYTMQPRQAVMAYTMPSLPFTPGAQTEIELLQPLVDQAEDLSIYALAHRIGMVERMLDAGVDPDTPNPKLKYTPLTAAAHMGDLAIVQLLLERGADPNRSGALGTPLAAAREGEKLRNGPFEEIRHALLAAGAKP